MNKEIISLDEPQPNQTETLALALETQDSNLPYKLLSKQKLGPQLEGTVVRRDVSLQPLPINEYDFEAQRRNFNHQIVRSRNKRFNKRPKPLAKHDAEQPETPLNSNSDGEDVDRHSKVFCPWGSFDESDGVKSKQEWGPTEEERARFEHFKATKVANVPRSVAKFGPGLEQSIFHGKEEHDYLGRTYMHAPQDLDIKLDKVSGTFDCFAPKRQVHTWHGHSKGVTSIKLFPGSGHLLLSGSQDTRIKLWQVYGDRNCLRTFLGHTRPVKEVWFALDGTKFASCGYDQQVKYWDTESGKCITSLQPTGIPYCVRLHPDKNRPWALLAGCSDRRIVQWDLRTPDSGICQEYNQHLDAVNSITFFDEGRRFVSTSDDKTIRVWEYEIPVATRYIAEPDMHSMPIAALHPDKTHVAFQSLANQVVVFAAFGDKFQNKRKKYVGHSTAGYACGLSFSPDGRFLSSGDGKGQLIIWDWKTGQLVRRIKAHDRVCIDVEWSPQDPSQVITCSWDGSIKMWD